MSAYLCNPEHIAAIAAFASSPRDTANAVIYDWRLGSHKNDAANCARELAMANIASVAARYPNDESGNRPGPCGMTDDSYIQTCGDIAMFYAMHPTPLKPVDIIKMCGCYEYQACEAPNWSDSDACRQAQWIVNKAHRLLPGWEDAVRDFHDPGLSSSAA